MADSDQRNLPRESLFVLANLRLNGDDTLHRVKVRNLSPGGLMAQSPLRIARGTALALELRQIGWVSGVVAWVQETRFGVAFDAPIDPKLIRAVTPPESAFTPLRPLAAQSSANPLRKV